MSCVVDKQSHTKPKGANCLNTIYPSTWIKNVMDMMVMTINLILVGLIGDWSKQINLDDSSFVEYCFETLVFLKKKK